MPCVFLLPILAVCLLLAAPGVSCAQVLVDGDVLPSPANSPTWTIPNTDTLYVGKTGAGNMTITPGGSVITSNSYGYIGYDFGSTGLAKVNGGNWTNPGHLFVGSSGNGTLEISGTGSVSNSKGLIGDNFSSTGLAKVSGGNWTNSSQLSVGVSGNGSLEISGTGTVSNSDGTIGFNPGSTGLAKVSGGTWDNFGFLVAGYFGNGTLEISGNGSVSSSMGNIGTYPGSKGLAKVSGGNWTNSGLLAVGVSGNGTLEISGTGTVSNSMGTIAGTGYATGVAKVSGGNWINSVSLSVGDDGNGTLEISGTGLVGVGANGMGVVNLAKNRGSVGTLNIGSFSGNSTAGTLNAAEVKGGAGTATVNFNQTDGISFAPKITRSTAVNQLGSGTTTLNGNISYSGITTIKSGTLNFASDTSQLIGNIANDGALQFTQTDDSLYNGKISGNGSVQQNGTSVLSLSGASTYTGGTTINAGVLQTTSPGTLGTGPANLQSGVLAPVETLSGISSLNWSLNGTIALTPARGDRISLTGNLNNLDAAGKFLIGTSGLTRTTYTLVSFDTTNFTVQDFTAVFSDPNASFQHKFVLNSDSVQLTILGASFSGNELHNIDNGVPTFGSFTTTGNVVSGLAPDGTQEPNTIIQSLGTTPGSSLDIPDWNTLNITGDGNTEFVSGSSLNLDGTLVANQVVIDYGALMTGHGLLNGNLLNEGTVAPGNSPGTLTVVGNFTQTGTGTLQVELASLSDFDRLIVGGTASLAGTLQVQSFGGFTPQYGQQFPFLQAANITGDFDTITTWDPAHFRARFLQNGGTGTILIAPSSYTLVAETQNQKNVAKALNGFVSAKSGDKETVSIALDLQSESQYPAAFDAVAPTFYESLADITIEQTNARAQMLAQRASAVRLGARGFQAIGIEAPLKYDKDGRSVMDAKDGKNILSPADNNNWGVWVQGNGIFARATSVGQVPSYNFQNGGFLVGVDYRWSENFVTGVYGGYQGTHAKYSNGGVTTINAVDFGLYAGYQNCGFYVDAILGGGSSSYAVRRPIKFSTVDRTATSRPDGGQFTSYLGLGYDWQAGNFTFGPILTGQYTYAGIAPFTENGAGALDLAVGQQNASSLRTSLGGRVAYTWNVSKSIALIPEARLLWQHEFLENSRNIGASLDGGAGSSFGYTTSAPARDAVFAAAGISAQFGPNWTASFYYNADFGRQDYISHSISTGLNFKF